ncbi:MAG: protease complex subunit PrcB family protein [Roseburia sp.]
MKIKGNLERTMKKKKKALEDIFPSGVYELCVLGVLILLVVIGSLFSGCAMEKTDRTKICDLTFTIVEEENIPEELKDKIEEKKAADFKLSYETEEDLYIVRGYGEQETGGYSISVEELYLTGNAIFFKTKLLGPRKGENIVQSPSFPYLVIKTELREENVVFE